MRIYIECIQSFPFSIFISFSFSFHSSSFSWNYVFRVGRPFALHSSAFLIFIEQSTTYSYVYFDQQTKWITGVHVIAQLGKIPFGRACVTGGGKIFSIFSPQTCAKKKINNCSLFQTLLYSVISVKRRRNNLKTFIWSWHRNKTYCLLIFLCQNCKICKYFLNFDLSSIVDDRNSLIEILISLT